MKLTPVTLSIAILAFAIVGFFVGRITAPADLGANRAADPSGSLDTRPSRAGQPLAGANSDRPNRPAGERSATSRETFTTNAARNSRLESIVRGENPLDRSRALLNFIDQLGPNDFEDAVAHFRGLGITEDRMGEYGMLLNAWASADPIGALDYVQANTRGDFARNTILASWASADPDAAVRWATANHEGDGPNPHMAGVIRGIAATDTNRATDLLTAMPRSRERGEALNGMMPHLLASGAQATRDWIDSIGDDSLRNGALERSAARLAALDPAMAADMLIANPGSAQDRRLDDVYREWAGQDQGAALAAMTALPQGDLRSNALRGIVSNTAQNDPRAAVQLLDQYSGDVNDRVLRSVAWNAFRQDPSVSADLIARYSDPRSQERMYRRTLGVWLDRDADAARDWINRNPLPESVVEHLADRL